MGATAVRIGQSVVVRVGQLFSRPVLVIPLLAVPLLAGGLHAVATGAPDASVEGHHSTPAVSAAADTDPHAAARAAIDRAEIPLGLLESGFERLTDGATQLDDGAGEMASGLTRARDGGSELSEGLAQLDAGLGELGDGSARLNEGVSSLVGALSGAAAIQGQVVQILTDTINDLSTVDDDAARRAVDQLTALRDVVQGNGMQDLSARLEELRAGSQEITFQLDDPQSPFAGGMNRAADGAVQLRDGLVALDDGGRRLTDGTDELVTRVEPVDGVLASLASALDDARAALPATDVDPSTPTADAVISGTAGQSASLATFPIAVLILIGSTLAAMSLRGSGIRALLPAGLTAVCGWVTLVGSGWATTANTMAAAAGLIALATAAIAATGGALVAATGPVRGRRLLAAFALAQVLLAAIVAIDADRLARSLSLFTPIGWLNAGLGAAATSAPLRDLAVPVLVFGTALTIAASILAAARPVTAERDSARTNDIDTETDSTPARNDPVIDVDELDSDAADAIALVAAGRPLDGLADAAADSSDGVDSNSFKPV